MGCVATNVEHLPPIRGMCSGVLLVWFVFNDVFQKQCSDCPVWKVSNYCKIQVVNSWKAHKAHEAHFDWTCMVTLPSFCIKILTDSTIQQCKQQKVPCLHPFVGKGIRIPMNLYFTRKLFYCQRDGGLWYCFFFQKLHYLAIHSYMNPGHNTMDCEKHVF